MRINPDFAKKLQRVFIPDTFNLKDGHAIIVPYFDIFGTEYEDSTLQGIVEEHITWMMNGLKHKYNPMVKYIDVGIWLSGEGSFEQKDTRGRKPQSDLIFRYPKRGRATGTKFGI